MLLSKQQLGAIALASADPTRDRFCGLHVRPDGSVQATNGMLAVTVQRTEPPADSDYPSILPETAKAPAHKLTLDAGAIKAIAKAVPKLRHMPILANAVVAQDGEQVILGTTDLSNPTLIRTTPFEAEFPNVDACAPTSKPVFRIRLNANLLKQLAQYALTFDMESYAPIDFTFYSDSKPVGFSFTDPDHTVTGLLMPVAPPKVTP